MDMLMAAAAPAAPAKSGNIFFETTWCVHLSIDGNHNKTLFFPTSPFVFGSQF
jgi:hypothetical protein